CSLLPRTSSSPLFPYTTLFRSRVICLSCRLEHAFHSFWHDSRSDEIVPLNIAAISIVLDAEVQLDKIAPPDPGTVVADMAHWVVADQHGGTTVNRPGRAELSLLEKLVRKLVDFLVLLSRLDRIFQVVVDRLAFSDRLLDQLDLSRDESSPQSNSKVLRRDQSFRVILQGASEIRVHA